MAGTKCKHRPVPLHGRGTNLPTCGPDGLITKCREVDRHPVMWARTTNHEPRTTNHQLPTNPPPIGVDSALGRLHMHRFAPILVLAIVVTVAITSAQQPSSTGPYKVLKTAKVGGEGNWDYIYADVAGRRLYIPRRAPAVPAGTE